MAKKSHCKRGHPRTPDNVGRDNSCKICKRARWRAHYKDNTEAEIERSRKWHETNPLRSRALYINNHSDLNIEKVYQYLLERGEVTVCDICQQECPTGRRLAIDHNHETKEIRGFLCNTCNRGLGMFRDSIKLMEKAVEYLKGANNG